MSSWSSSGELCTAVCRPWGSRPCGAGRRAYSETGSLRPSGWRAVGLVLGGFLVEVLSWPWIFFVNVPVGIVAFVLSLRLVPESKDEHVHKTFDLAGAATVTGGLIALVYGIVRSAEKGWGSPEVLGFLALAAVLLVAFVLIERSSVEPLVRLSIFPISRSTFYEDKPVREPTEDEWDRLDALLDSLARHGVRVQIPLVENDPQWSSQAVVSQVDRAGVAHLYPFFDPVARARQKAWLRAFLTHPNKRRGVPLAKDPAVAIVEVSNESGILRGFLSGSYDQLPTLWRGRIQAASIVARVAR